MHDKTSELAKSHSSKITIFPSVYASKTIPLLNFIILFLSIESLPKRSSTVECSDNTAIT